MGNVDGRVEVSSGGEILTFVSWDAAVDYFTAPGKRRQTEDSALAQGVENFSRGETDGEAGAADWGSMLEDGDYARGAIRGMVTGGIISEADAANLRAELAEAASVEEAQRVGAIWVGG